jgi:diaminopimelate decarboxylase
LRNAWASRRPRRILNGNGRTAQEAEYAAREGVHSVNADHIGELDLLEEHAARASTRVRVALRVNPGIPTGGHDYVATGHDQAKFGVAPAEAVEAWAARARWPHLNVDGLHLHVGSQLLDPGPLERAAEIARQARRRIGRSRRTDSAWSISAADSAWITRARRRSSRSKATPRVSRTCSARSRSSG